jgi:kynurenine 3-monooxygenase
MNEEKAPNGTITLIGAGLVGSLLAIYLARRGFDVELYERRPDMRTHAISAGRSINLAISTRGIHALKKLDLDEKILAHAVPMRGRMIHNANGDLIFQPYGTDDSEYINSISRATLNKELMTAAEATGRVRIVFNHRVTGFDFDTNALMLHDEERGVDIKRLVNIAIGTDGSASAIRHSMEKLPGFQSTASELNYGYKELVIPPGEGGSFQIERNALHIWPRGSYMLIALPNFEGSFTCTLFLPWEGDPSFAKLQTRTDVQKFFEEHFADAVPLIEHLQETFETNPTGHMVTVKTKRWNVDGRVLLMGDAAHGIVPFYGQGMNCGFEDCTVFDDNFDRFRTKDGGMNWGGLFDFMTMDRVPNTDAIADMAVENFVEMRDKVGDKKFLMQKAVEKILQVKFPGRYVSRYSLVTFSNVPYTVAQQAGVAQERMLSELCAGLKDANEVDLVRAEKLIDQTLAPYFTVVQALAPTCKESEQHV